MDDRRSFEQEALAALEFLGDPEAAALIAARVASQYGPALRTAPHAAARTRAWEALRFYLTARPTRRKPFALSDAEAQCAMDALRPLILSADS